MAFKSKKSLSGPATPQKRISVAPVMTLPPRPKSQAPVEKPEANVARSKVPGLIAVTLGAIALVWYYTKDFTPTIMCNMDGFSPQANTTCIPCPNQGVCSGGRLQSCAEHYLVRGTDCIRDEQKFLNAVSMLDAIAYRLALLRGEKECGESVDDTLYPDQFRSVLRTEFKSLSDSAFRAAFELAVDGEADGIYLPSTVVRTPMGLVRSTMSKKSFKCRARETILQYGLTVLILVLTSIIVIWKFKQWSARRSQVKDIIRTIESHTHVVDDRVQGLSVLDLRDSGMPLNHLDDKEARQTMSLMLRTYPDIQSGEDISRAGEVVYWSAHRLRAEQSRASVPTKADHDSPKYK